MLLQIFIQVITAAMHANIITLYTIVAAIMYFIDDTTYFDYSVRFESFCILCWL